ncbi:MAG TPA: Crp/Fnr family transcriptional regulator [Flavisolibacter sp.]|nr:Crp/Fnr family transcriptional regulator [Flavisolibacter sp.]
MTKYSGDILPNWLLRLTDTHPLSDELREHLLNSFEIKSYSKKEILLRPGQVSNHACFILKGLVRAYYISDEGQDITSRIMDENFLITSWISFYTRKPTDEYIQTLEDTVLSCIHYDNLEKLYNNYPDFNILGRKLIEHFLYLAEQRTRLLRKHTAEEKYRLFLQQHPELLQRVPLHYIATYLGMSEETLSRIRSKKTH